MMTTKIKTARMLQTLAAAALFLLASWAVRTATAEPFPTQVVTLVLPYSAGTGIDIAARLLAERMQQRLKQPVIVENRVGAGGNIGSTFVAKAKPDGYTLLLVANTLAMSPSLYDLSYDPVTSFVPIGLFLKGAMVLAVNRDVKASTTAELIALAKMSPGKLNYGSPGLGTPQHLAMELFKSTSGIDVMHVPYKGAGEAMIGMIRGENDMMFAAAQSALPNIGDGRIRALGISSPVPLPLIAHLPTIATQISDPNFNVDLWYGFFAPAGTPQAVVKILNDEINAIAAMPSVQERLNSLALIPAASSPDELGRLLQKDIDRWSAIIRKADIAKR